MIKGNDFGMTQIRCNKPIDNHNLKYFIIIIIIVIVLGLLKR